MTWSFLGGTQPDPTPPSLSSCHIYNWNVFCIQTIYFLSSHSRARGLGQVDKSNGFQIPPVPAPPSSRSKYLFNPKNHKMWHEPTFHSESQEQMSRHHKIIAMRHEPTFHSESEEQMSRPTANKSSQESRLSKSRTKLNGNKQTMLGKSFQLKIGIVVSIRLNWRSSWSNFSKKFRPWVLFILHLTLRKGNCLL